MNDQYKIVFPSDKIRLKKIYQSEDSEKLDRQVYTNSKIQEVYGDFSFPVLPEDRTYTLGSFVQSIDGKIAFPESPDGTLVAKGNLKDRDGALADYWILNMLRTVCDAVLMGARTIDRESELTGRIYDPDLENLRIKAGKPAVPLHIIVSGTGSGIPVNHRILRSPEIPVLIVTTPKGKEILADCLDPQFIDLNNFSGVCLTDDIKAVVSIGNGNGINLLELLDFLKQSGVDTMLIESPTFLVSLMQEALLDELYINTSTVFIGGGALSLGNEMNPFTFNNHPHGKVISIHSHSDYFYYIRYRMEYDESDATRK
ncbi:MAG: dihydrofolate reductase family protein [Bacteroidetes bacterium]|nr:dihydrofolate reductase family protein [Bacteroidota bacterium]